ncbi:MAG: prenyltransferase/squalene oxidase repeat-containing protein, partial [Solirubrobacteraceae bacterium]
LPAGCAGRDAVGTGGARPDRVCGSANVKPTTDIVLVAGYTLGGAPGYIVGASSALASNFFFGQGPWTPWQMAGWGAVGVMGALLARVTRNHISRGALAVVCFLVGFWFTALQDFGDWVMYSDHSLAALGLYVGQGLGFDLIHAVGCFVFAMAFGPALIAALGRFRARIEIRWLPRVPEQTLLVVLVAGLGVGLAQAHLSRAAEVRRSPTAYLLSAQNRDGGFGMARGQASNDMVSAWAMMALGASGVDVRDLSKPGGSSAITYLEHHRPGRRDAAGLERTLLAAGAAGAASEFRAQSQDLRLLVARDGAVSGQVNMTAFGILALRAVGAPVPASMRAWLVRQQDRDGGFNYLSAPGQSDVDDTGAVLSALGAGGPPKLVARARAYLVHAQNRDGGFGEEPGMPSNAQSTAFAVCGLDAVGVRVGALHRRGAPSPLAYLKTLISSNGSVDYARGVSESPVWVSAQVLLALTGHQP